jgi:hypothetical protein
MTNDQLSRLREKLSKKETCGEAQKILAEWLKARGNKKKQEEIAKKI